MAHLLLESDAKEGVDLDAERVFAVRGAETIGARAGLAWMAVLPSMSASRRDAERTGQNNGVTSRSIHPERRLGIAIVQKWSRLLDEGGYGFDGCDSRMPSCESAEWCTRIVR